MPSAEFNNLLRRAQQGEREAMDQLLVELRPHLEELAHGYADPERPDESTADLVQEASLKAWQKLDQFGGDDDDAKALATFRSWIAQIVRRLGLNAQRDRRRHRRKPQGRRILSLDAGGDDSTMAARRPKISPAARGPTPSADLQSREEVDLVEKAIEKIADPTVRDVVRLRFFEDLSLGEIAARLDLSYDTVRERYRVGVRQLESELDGLQ